MFSGGCANLVRREWNCHVLAGNEIAAGRLIERKSTQLRDPREHVIKHIDATIDESLINGPPLPGAALGSTNWPFASNAKCRPRWSIFNERHEKPRERERTRQEKKMSRVCSFEGAEFRYVHTHSRIHTHDRAILVGARAWSALKGWGHPMVQRANGEAESFSSVRRWLGKFGSKRDKIKWWIKRTRRLLSSIKNAIPMQ